jgi:hypothetical protein
MDYEFGTVFDLTANHNATVSKDRTGIFDGSIFTITPETGKVLRNWLNSGAPEADNPESQVAVNQ